MTFIVEKVDRGHCGVSHETRVVSVSVSTWLKTFDMSLLLISSHLRAHQTEHKAHWDELRKEVMQKRQPGDKTLMWSLVLVMGFDCLKHVGYLSMWRLLNDSWHERDLTECVIRSLTMSLRAWVTVWLVFPPFMIMAVFTSSVSLGALLSRKRLERFVLGFLREHTNTWGDDKLPEPQHTMWFNYFIICLPVLFSFSPMSCLPQLANKGNINSLFEFYRSSPQSQQTRLLRQKHFTRIFPWPTSGGGWLLEFDFVCHVWMKCVSRWVNKSVMLI